MSETVLSTSEVVRLLRAEGMTYVTESLLRSRIRAAPELQEIPRSRGRLA